MDTETFVELTMLQIRGVCAQAFIRANVKPSAEHMEMLRDERTLTMRDIGEMGYVTGHDFSVQFGPMAQSKEPPHDQ